MGRSQTRLVGEREVAASLPGSGKTSPRPVRSLTVNVTESPLGWLLAHGHVTTRQFDAGAPPRCDWARAQLAPQVTMAWDSAPVARGRGGAAVQADLNGAQIDAKRRFNQA